MAKQTDILESEDVLSLPRLSKNNDILEKALAKICRVILS